MIDSHMGMKYVRQVISLSTFVPLARYAMCRPDGVLRRVYASSGPGYLPVSIRTADPDRARCAFRPGRTQHN
jgi:hypothetical protein